MVDFDHQHMEFKFEGEFLGFVQHEGKLKYLRLGVLSEELQIKLPKAVRMAVGMSLQPGESIQVTGIGKFDRPAHDLKLKATQITPLKACTPVVPASSSLVSPSEPKINPKPKIKVLVCQKSGCLKKGGKGLCEALGQLLRDRNLEQFVTIERTGCVKRCSAAPNLVVMPGNQRYTEVRAKTLPQVAEAIAQSLTEL
ncbi:(2Fe-2S) ferredoxin domain-containing protein [Phormidesmis sp. 146-35]